MSANVARQLPRRPARARIDDHATPLEEAEIPGRADAVRLSRELAPG